MGTDSTERELAAAVNRACAENGSNTPDFILGGFLRGALEAFDAATRAREQWYGVRHEPGQGRVSSELAATLVFEALGAASVCWDNPGGAGVFDSDRAARIGRGLLEALGYEVPENYRERVPESSEPAEPVGEDVPVVPLMGSEPDEQPSVSLMPTEMLARRSPIERERYLGAQEAGRREAGQPVDVVLAARETLAEMDRQTQAGLAQWARRVVGSFCSEHREELAALPAAIAQGLVVEVTVAYLFGYGLMTPAPAGEADWHPIDWREAIPVHLHPDVAGAVASHERMLAALPQPDHGHPHSH